MAAQIGPDNREVRRFVDLDAEIKKPRAITTISMQQHHCRGAFGAFQQPAARAASIERGPGLISNLDRASTDSRKRFRSDYVRSFGGTCNAVNNKAKGTYDGQHNYQRYWQERLD
jgi:hypothetical protein